MKNDLVTVFGGSGFLGRYIVRRLAAEGARVRVVCRHPHKAIHLKPMGEVGQITLERGNVTRIDDLGRFVEGASYVVNLIGILFEKGAQTFDTVQAETPARIAEAAAAARVRQLVQLSAIGADATSEAAYARTKAAGEAAVRRHFPDAVVLRPSVVFGPEDDFFNRFGKMAQISPFLPLIDGGGTRFQPVYVDDVARAVLVALTDKSARGETFELGGPTVYTFKQLLEYLLSLLDRRRALINLPANVARFQARFTELLPSPPLTRDQIALLASDNVVAAEAKTLNDLGIQATPLEVIVPTYVERYARRHSRRL